MSDTIREKELMTNEELEKFAEVIKKAIGNNESSDDIKKYIDRVKIRRKELIDTLVDYLDIKLPKYTVSNKISLHSPDKHHLVEIYEDSTETIVKIKHIKDVAL